MLERTDRPPAPGEEATAWANLLRPILQHFVQIFDVVQNSHIRSKDNVKAEEDLRKFYSKNTLLGPDHRIILAGVLLSASGIHTANGRQPRLQKFVKVWRNHFLDDCWSRCKYSRRKGHTDASGVLVHLHQTPANGQPIASWELPSRDSTEESGNSNGNLASARRQRKLGVSH